MKKQRSSRLRKIGALFASTLKPEEQEFVVDSGASMHMISKKDLSNFDMDTLTKSCSPTVVITANGEVQTHEEAVVYVKELDMLLILKVLENTPAVLLFGKLCDENGYCHEWSNCQKPHHIQDGIRKVNNSENFVHIVVLGLSNSGFDLSISSRRIIAHPFFSSSSSSLTTNDITIREREDRTESDISSAILSTTADERSGRPGIDQANKIRKPKQQRNSWQKRDNPLDFEIPKWLQDFGANNVYSFP